MTRQLRLSNNKVSEIVTDYLSNIGYNVESSFIHTKGITVDVSNKDVSGFEESLKEEEQH
jgi:tRNA G26 N,N-dimethylase Trm1